MASQCHNPHLETGPHQERSDPSNYQEVNVSTIRGMCSTSLEDLGRLLDAVLAHHHLPPRTQQPPPQFSTQESPVQNKKRQATSSARLNTCAKRIRTLNSSRTLGRVSTTNERDCSRFWNESCKEWSDKLWLPTETDLHASEWTCWNGCSRSMGANSWFSTKLSVSQTTPPNSVMTSLRSAISSSPKTMGSEQGGISDDELSMRTKLVGLKTTHEQTVMWKRWLGTTRCIWNQCVDLVNTHQILPTLKELRTRLVNKNAPWVLLNPWLQNTPYDIREDVVRRFVANYQTSKKRHGLLGFEMHHQTKKEHTQSLYIRHRGFHDGRNYHTQWGKLKGIVSRESGIWNGLDLQQDTRLVFHRPASWYMAITRPVRNDTQILHTRRPVIALDPGSRTFQTGYDPSGAVIECAGIESRSKIYNQCLEVDSLIALAKGFGGKKGRRLLNHRIPLLRQGIQRRITDLHCKLASWLCKNYETVLLPSFNVSQMVKRTENRDDGSTRRLNHTAARMLLSWNHYKFKQRLLNKGQELGCKVIIVNEAYTTKTCTRCGVVRGPLQGKTFQCESDSCGLVIDRDINGSRNILLRHLI